MTYQKMNPEAKKLWLEALRSGEYKQGRDGLCYNDKFCPLGVAYDVCVDGYWEMVPGYPGYWAIVPAGKPGLGTTTTLPGAVRDELGLSWDDACRVMKLNDIDHLTFPEIADWIEENL